MARTLLKGKLLQKQQEREKPHEHRYQTTSASAN